MKIDKKILTTRKAIDPEAVKQSAGHCLYVEGVDGSIDSVVLKVLFRDYSLRIENMGPSYNISNVAEALHNWHPHYYFLIDRDDHGEEAVENLWTNFPDPAQKNLLVWRKKEIENYFIEPTFIERFRNAIADNQDFEIGSQQAYLQRLQDEATRRIYFDAANRVVVKVRKRLMSNRYKIFRGPDGLETAEAALEKLLQRLDLEQKIQRDREIVDSLDLTQCFHEEVNLLLDGADSCFVGRGKWLELMAGKEILHALIHSPLFTVRDRQGNALEGDRKLHEIVKAMTRLPDAELPGDFLELKHLIIRRLG